MTATTHPEFNDKTEALEVANAFPESVKGKTILIVGVNRGGLGFATAAALASQSPARLIIAGRTPSRLQECIDALKQDYPQVEYRLLSLDLARQSAIRASAAELLSWTDVPTIDIVINNAAIMLIPEREIDEAGIERTFATNHVGHFLFTCSIMPKLIAAAKGQREGAVRVINLSSLSPTTTGLRWSDMNFEKVNKTLPEDEQPQYQVLRLFGVENPEEKSYTAIESYSNSKVANVLFSIALNDRLFENHGILSLACHPGIIQTELARYASEEARQAVEAMQKTVFQIKTLGAGAATTVTTALDPKLGMPINKKETNKENYGVFFSDCQINDHLVPRAASSAHADRLWKYTEDLVKETFAW